MSTPTYVYDESVMLSPGGLTPMGMQIVGDPAEGTPPTHTTLVGIVRPSVAQLPLSQEQLTAIFTAAHAAYPE